MAKYLIKHWVNADVIVEKVVDESEIDTVKNDLKQYKTPDSSFSFVMINFHLYLHQLFQMTEHHLLNEL